MAPQGNNAPLPTKEILSNIHLTGILNSTISATVKRYTAVTYTNEGRVLYAWALNSPDTVISSANKEADGSSLSASGSILQAVKLELAMSIVRQSFKIIKANKKLALEFDSIQEDQKDLLSIDEQDGVSYGVENEKTSVPDVTLQLIRTNYSKNKEIMIVPSEDLIMTIVVSKV